MSFKPFKPFDKILCRDSKSSPWTIDIFIRYIEDNNFPYHGFTASWKECIHYEGNEHLYNTTNDYFKPEFGDIVLFPDNHENMTVGIIIRTNGIDAVIVPRDGAYIFYARPIKELKPFKE